MAIQWFPGHMAAARKKAAETMAQIDVVIEVLDARLPRASGNPLVEQLRRDATHGLIRADFIGSEGMALGLVPEKLLGLDKLAGCTAITSDRWLTPSGVFILSLVAGSLVSALLSGEFRIRVGRPRTYALAAAGGLMMGFGAMISLGCTVGTMLSGIMAFSLHGWVFTVGLAAGAWAGTKVLRSLA